MPKYTIRSKEKTALDTISQSLGSATQKSTRIRVLTVMPGLGGKGGAERSLAAIAPLLSELGVDLHVAVLSERQGLVKGIESAGIPVHDLSSGSSMVARVVAIRRCLAEVKPDLIHATLFYATQPAQIAGLLDRVPTLVTWANTDYSSDSHQGVRLGAFKFRVLRAWETILARLCRTTFHAVTTGVAEHNGSKLKVPTRRIMVGERGRDASDFVVDPQDVTHLRESLEIPHGGHVILSVGRQDLQKGQDELVRTFDRYASRHPDDRLLIAGREGSGTAQLNQALDLMEHRRSVVILGHRPDLPKVLASADVLVCASHREGAAGAVIEAMAARVPVVARPLLGLKDVLIDGENARVGPLDEFPAILENLLLDDNQRRRLADCAYRCFENRFTVQGSAERISEIYAWAASQPTSE